MIEQILEDKIADAIAHLPSAVNCQVIASRSVVAAGCVKGEAEVSKPQIVAVSLGLRQHDAFSLPTVNIQGSIVLTTRRELCPTGAEHEQLLGEIVGMFSRWHSDGEAMSSRLSDVQFFAAELRMDGGTGKVYDDSRSAWVESISFTVRCTLLGL